MMFTEHCPRNRSRPCLGPRREEPSLARDDLPAALIAEDLLQRTGAALLNGDSGAFADCFALPQVFETVSGRVVAETRGHLVRMFQAVQQKYRCMGVTDLVRHVVQAEYRDHETIAFTHESRLLQGTTLLQAPFPTFSIVKYVDGLWLVHASSYGPTHDSIAGRVLNSALSENLKSPPQGADSLSRP